MEKKYISIYEKYSNYSKEAILLAINTLPINDRMILKKKFGPSYLGNGYTFKNDESNYQLAEKNLLKRIIEVSEMLKLGKNSQEIMNYYRNAYVKSIYNSYSNYTTNIQTIKLKESFIENFLPQYRNIVKEQLLDSLTTEEKEIICLFYLGKDYSFLKKDIDSTKYKEFNSLFFKLNDKARKIFQQKGISIKNTTPRNKKIKIEEKVKEIKEEQGLLHHFDEKDYDKVLKIVESLKITNPNYYDVICKKYSGEKYEIRNNIKLSKEEQTVFNIALRKIRRFILNNEINTFLHYFEEKDYEKVLDIVENFKITNPNYYDVICKKYSGEKYEIRNNIKLSKKEQTIFKNALQKIKNVILCKTGNKVLKQTKKDSGFLHYFDAKDHEKVLDIIESLKITNPNYYEVIYKNYSGKRYEIKNNDRISKSDYRLLMNGITKIRKMLLNNVEVKTVKEIKEENGLLHYFEEKDHEKVLKIIEKFKITNSNYYEIICKKYSGEKYEIKNNIKLSRKDQNLFNSALFKIKNMLLNNMEIKYNIYQLKKQISNLEFTDDCIDYCIDNLNYFSKDHSIELINLIAKYYPHKIKKIVESDYLNEKFKLSLKKQEYIYLKLLSYTNKHLTKDVILKILNEENLEKNKIMDIEEQVDELDQKIKNLAQKNR